MHVKALNKRVSINIPQTKKRKEFLLRPGLDSGILATNSPHLSVGSVTCQKKKVLVCCPVRTKPRKVSKEAAHHLLKLWKC